MKVRVPETEAVALATVAAAAGPIRSSDGATAAMAAPPRLGRGTRGGRELMVYRDFRLSCQFCTFLAGYLG